MRAVAAAWAIGCLIGCRDDVAPLADGIAGEYRRPATESEEGGAGGAPATPDRVETAAGQSIEASECAAERVTLQQIHEGRVRSDTAIEVGPLRLSSQKFLIAEAKSGSCLWGAYAAEPDRAGAGSGLLLVSFGAEHPEGEACRAGSDALPDDLAPGDVVEARGFVDSFAPSSCPRVAPARQLRIDATCPLARTGSGPPPEATAIDLGLADRLARGEEAQLLEAWGGALVRLEDVTALQDQEDGDAVFPFGVVRLAETSLELRSRLYYFDLTEGGPKASQKSPHYPFPTGFPSVTGIVLLDYCSWVLAPRDRCNDAAGADGCGQAARP
jgi:hypothetical protein